MPSLTQTLEHAIHHAIGLAEERNHPLSTLEHLLLALVDEPDAAHLLRACAVNLSQLRYDLRQFIDDEMLDMAKDDAEEETAPSTGFQRVIQRAAIHVQSSGRSEVTGANVLVAIFAERESHAVSLLEEHDMTRYDAVNYLSHGVAKDPNFAEMPKSWKFETEQLDTMELEEPVIVKKVIVQRILDNYDSVHAFSKFLSSLVRQEIERVSSTRPNSPSALRIKEQQIELLEFFLLAFTRISEALEHLGERPESARAAHLSRNVEEAWRPIGEFLSRNGEGWINAGVNLGLVGCGVAFFSFLGLPPVSSITPTAAVVTAPTILRLVGKLNINLSTTKRIHEDKDN